MGSSHRRVEGFCTFIHPSCVAWHNYDMNYLLRGIVLGFTIAAPVGPIGVLCIRRTLARGLLSGFVSGLGAASADAIYGAIAAFGLGLITTILVENKAILGFGGGIFLCFLGINTFFDKPAKLKSGNKISANNLYSSNLNRRKIRLSDYGSTFFLTLTNPMTILAFTAIYAGIGLFSVETSTMFAVALVAGVFIGSSSWWLILCYATSRISSRVINPTNLRWINRISGVILIGFGVLAILSVIN